MSMVWVCVWFVNMLQLCLSLVWWSVWSHGVVVLWTGGHRAEFAHVIGCDILRVGYS